VTLLALQGKPLGYEGDAPFYGIDHFGLWVDDIDAARRKVEAAGATYVMGEHAAAPGAFYEIKYRDPLGNIFDLTTNGWAGAVKDVVPAEAPVSAKAAV
jgi:methylmalonyl-CoA/ethylmalonyl-CoA epimerase